jgi:hypothetical protein
MTADWLPHKRTEQLAMAKTWITVLTAKGTQWQVTEAETGELGDLAEDAENWLTKAMSADRNAVITAQCNETFGKLTAFMRNLRNRRFFVPPLSDPDLVYLGLRPKDTIRTPVPDPTGQAEADITYPGPHLLMLHLKPIEGTLIDPRADHGYRIYFGILPAGGGNVEEAAGPMRYLMKAAVTGTDLPHSQFSRRRKVLMEFPAEDSGKTAYFSIRFENAKGGKGPWGPVFSAIIP